MENPSFPLYWKCFQLMWHYQLSYEVQNQNIFSSVSSVQFLSRIRLFATTWITARLPPCPSPTPGVYPDLCPSSRWCHPTISSSIVPLSSCPQSFQASGFFQMSQLFTTGGQSTGVSASASVLPVNIQDWFPLGLTGLNMTEQLLKLVEIISLTFTLWIILLTLYDYSRIKEILLLQWTIKIIKF